MEIIQINQDNYKKYIGLDILGFSIAGGGAMGEPGGVIICTKDLRWFHTNVCWTIEYDKLIKVIPPLRKCEFGPFGKALVPEGWFYTYLGMGNHLVLRDTLKQEFLKKTEGADSPGVIYQKWARYVAEIVGGEAGKD